MHTRIAELEAAGSAQQQQQMLQQQQQIWTMDQEVRITPPPPILQ
jgi:hypothetical protein